MIKKTITYEDYNGKEHTEDFYFHLSETELARMEMQETQILNNEAIGGLNARINAIIESGSGRLILEVFDDLLKKSYGVRSEDGSKFRKSEEAWEDFHSSGAYDVFFMELVTDADSAAEFVNGIIPKSVSEGSVEDPRSKPQDFQKKESKSKSKIKAVPNPTEVEDDSQEEEVHEVRKDNQEAIRNFQEAQAEEEKEVEKTDVVDISNLSQEQIEAIQKMKQD